MDLIQLQRIVDETVRDCRRAGFFEVTQVFEAFSRNIGKEQNKRAINEPTALDRKGSSNA